LKKVLEIVDLSISFKNNVSEKKILNNINLFVKKGESVGVVGPSGCGKSILSLACLNLLPASASFSGDIFFYNKTKKSVFNLNKKEKLKYRGLFSSIIFQNPFSSLNPVYTCGYSIKESLLRFKKHSKNELKNICFDLLKEVNIKNIEAVYNSYPHQLSGGQLQRVLIASSLALSPKLIIADEPTTALDASIKKNILNLLFSIIKKRNISLIIISHDINVIKNYTDFLYVLKNGNIIENGKTNYLLKKPKHNFTKKLILCKPKIGEKRKFLPSINSYKEIINKKIIKHNKILSLKNVSYFIKNKNILNNISFNVFNNDCIGIVGESGSGKSTIVKIICGLINNYSGTINYGINKKNIQLVFQDSISSLTPNYKVGDLLYEVCLFFKYEKNKIKKTILIILK